MITNTHAGECGYCEAPVAAGQGLCSDEEVFWRGASAATVYCGMDCESEAGEAAHEARLEDQREHPDAYAPDSRTALERWLDCKVRL